MEIFMHITDLLIILSYLLLTLAVGVYQGRNLKSMKDYAIADRKYSTPIMVCTLMATLIGGENTIGIAEKVFSEGIIYILMCAAFPLSTLIISRTAAGQIGRFDGCYSVGDIMATNFGDFGKVLTGFMGAALSLGYVAAQIGSTGFLLGYFFQIPYGVGVGIGTGLIIIYTMVGGIRSVTITDVIQLLALLVTLPIICNFGLQHFGGYTALLEHIPADKLTLSPQTISYSHYASLFLIFCIPFLDPAVIQRMLMAKDTSQIKKSLTLTAMLEIPFYMTIGLIALIALAYAPNINANNVFPFLIDEILPIGFKGLVVTGLLAVIMSTADSYLNVAGVTFVHDFLKPLMSKPLDKDKELRLTKIFTLVIGLIAIFIALKMQSIMELILSFVGIWGPVIVVPLYATLYGCKADKKTFIASITTGLSIYVLWYVFGLESTLKLDSLIPSLVANSAVFFTLAKRKKSSQKLQGGLMSMVNSLTNQNIGLESEKPPYGLFSIYALVTYIFPFFLWTDTLSTDPFSVLLRLLAALLFASLFFLDHIMVKQSRYVSVYWYGVLLYCLPFLSTYLLLLNKFHWFWISQGIMAVLILALLVESMEFLKIFIIGVLLGILTFMAVNQDTAFYAGAHEILLPLVYLYGFAVSFGFVFSRRREHLHIQKQQTLKSLAGSIAHEMRTPLAAVMLSGQGLRSSLTKLRTKLGVEEDKTGRGAAITMDIQQMDDISDTLLRVSKQSQGLISMLLNNLKGDFVHQKKTRLSMAEVAKHVMSTFPFEMDDENRVHLEVRQDFEFNGNLEVIANVFYNLLKNALYFIKAAGHGEVFITVDMAAKGGQVTFKDTGPGIENRQLSEIFDPFNSKRPHGTGLGLNFCKRAMESISGGISVTSKLGVHTTFVLEFNCE